MARPIGLSLNTVSLARSVTTADVANTDAALPAETSATTGGMVRGGAFQTMWIGLECADGTAPTCTVLPKVRDPEAPDGSRWKDLTIAGSAQSITLTNNGPFKEVRVDGRDWIPVVTVLGGAPSLAKILVFPGVAMPGRTVPAG